MAPRVRAATGFPISLNAFGIYSTVHTGTCADDASATRLHTSLSHDDEGLHKLLFGFQHVFIIRVPLALSPDGATVLGSVGWVTVQLCRASSTLYLCCSMRSRSRIIGGIDILGGSDFGRVV